MAKPEKTVVVGDNSLAADRLRSIVDRIERLEEERKALGADIKDIKTEAKSAGFDMKALNRLLRERREDDAEREEREILVDLYRRALGPLSDTPLGEATIRRVS
jgi:uncharacterized protein (UPF0335 family)